jgi:hypothetical protein
MAALAATWPLALHLSTAILMGTEREATVPLFNLWTLWWTADRADHGFAAYWDAPIFYPTRGAFSFSEPQPLTGLVVAPLWGLGVPPALVYNLAFLGLLTLNGIFGYRLARALDAGPLAALAGAAITVVLPFVSKVQGVLPLQALFGMLWALEGLVRFANSGRWPWAVWAGAGFIASYFTCQQCALLFAPFLGVAGVLTLAMRQFRVRALLPAVVAAAGAAIAIGLLAAPVLRIHREQGFQRSEQLVEALSAHAEDFFTRPSHAWVQIPPPSPDTTAGLFPGVALITLGVLGAVVGMRDPGRRRWAIYLTLTAALAALLALGLNFQLGGWRPFATLRAIIPGLAELRSAFRFAVITQVGLAILASLGLTWIGRSGKVWSRVLVVALGLVVVGESLSTPAQLIAVPIRAGAAWTDWLRTQQGDLVLAHVPFPNGLHVSEYEREAWRMFAQIDHRRPLVNGYSGYLPQTLTPLGQVIPTYFQFQLAMAQNFPEERLLCVLGVSLKANVLVVDNGWQAPSGRRLEEFAEFLQSGYQDENVHIFRIHIPADRCLP